MDVVVGQRPNIWAYYSQEFVINAILEAAENREAVGVFSTGSYEKRPNILQYSSDLLNMIKNGVTSVHLSVEHWRFPMHLVAENYDDLRKGFDIIIDIDSRVSLEESKITAVLICEFLQKYGIKNYGIKFSGRRGFHICVPWKMLPKEINFKPMHLEYPKVPRIVSDFIRHRIKDSLVKELLKSDEIRKQVEGKDDIDPFEFVEVEKDWGSRHLFRAPFSLNEKTWLVSKPISYQELKSFNPDSAKPENVKQGERFFKECEEGEADLLISDALDWHSINTKPEEKKVVRKRVSTKRIEEEFFPPCIKLIIAGLDDGKKRSLFTIINFLKSMNWSWEEIEEKLTEINNKNKPPLQKQIVLSQINWARHQNREINPANCKVSQYYGSIGICQPDSICTKGGKGEISIKNPMNYAFIKLSRIKKKERKLKCYNCKKEFEEMDTLIRHKKRHKRNTVSN